jgi:hypothetical protein
MISDNLSKIHISGYLTNESKDSKNYNIDITQGENEINNMSKEENSEIVDFWPALSKTKN